MTRRRLEKEVEKFVESFYNYLNFEQYSGGKVAGHGKVEPSWDSEVIFTM